jgi:hypothetical protein
VSGGLVFATLATLVGERNAARWGARRVTITSVGIQNGRRFVTGEFSDGSIVLGEPGDFSIPKKVKRVVTRLPRHGELRDRAILGGEPSL